MLKIRLQKVGKKNSPSYRVVLAEHTAPPQGKFQEILGFYNPRRKEKSFKAERIKHWISKGAQLSPTVYNLLIDENILEGVKLKAWKPKKRSKEKSSDLSAEADKAKAEVPSEAKSEGGQPAADQSEAGKNKEAEKPAAEKKEEKLGDVDKKEEAKKSEKKEELEKKEETKEEMKSGEKSEKSEEKTENEKNPEKE